MSNADISLNLFGRTIHLICAYPLNEQRVLHQVLAGKNWPFGDYMHPGFTAPPLYPLTGLTLG
jgi:hypothetical protein